MPLSEQEQRLLDEMERHLMRNDADVVSADRGTGPLSYRNIVYGSLIVLLGIAGLVVGVATSLIVIGVVAFVGLVAPPILLGSIAVHLSRDQALQQQLRSDPSLLPDAIEEFLRLYTPYRGFARTARHEVVLHGRRIRPGEPIALAYASANRDERVFPDPHEFRLRRPKIRQHLAFGRGPHACAGISLARQQLTIGLEELLKQTSHFEVCGEIRMSGMPELGPISVPLRLTPAR